MRGPAEERIPTFCALCISRCGAIATVEGGRLRSLEPDPDHPTGAALCVKGKAAPELVHHPERLRTPLLRTRPKGDPDPGWRPIGWDEALALAAERLGALARDHGPESVVFSAASPSTTALSDSIDWIDRLRRAFGSPNLLAAVELCAWGRYFATAYTFGAGLPGVYLPDLERAGAILYWGYNPSVARLSHATATAHALRRGARLVVVDPRRVGMAHRADEWLQVRPGTDLVLALALCHVLIERGWFDAGFVRRWTNGPHLVRPDGRLLRAGEVGLPGDPDLGVAWDEASGRPVAIDPRRPTDGADGGDAASLALGGEHEVATAAGPLRCRPVFDHLAQACRAAAPAEAAARCGVSAAQIERTARLLWEARPVAYYAWSGVEQHADATQISRALAQLYALLGDIEAPGGNVRFPAVASNPVDGADLLSDGQRARALGLPRRPLGSSRWEVVTSDDVYTAALDGRPYRIRGLVGFGSNLLLAYADSRRGRDALAALDFYVHTDLFMNPTAELADLVLPVASPFETEGLALGFEVSEAAQSRVQLRRPLVAPPGEARSDLQIIFALATRLGLGRHFWDGDVDAGLRHQLAPSGLSLEALRAAPAGLTVPLETRHRTYAAVEGGRARAFATPSGLVELFSERMLDHGYPPFPALGDRPPGAAVSARYPLVLTSAKGTWYCESQHRGIASLRRRAPEPEVELHPATAAARHIAAGDWVEIETAAGRFRARARLVAELAPDVVCGQHGWWQACAELDAPAYDPLSPGGANFNLAIRHEPSDPVGGTVAHRACPCQVSRCA
jgi:anaerobic selenocysteine-containing dehydrogenase